MYVYGAPGAVELVCSWCDKMEVDDLAFLVSVERGWPVREDQFIWRITKRQRKGNCYQIDHSCLALFHELDIPSQSQSGQLAGTERGDRYEP
jgi:hypothetical protein